MSIPQLTMLILQEMAKSMECDGYWKASYQEMWKVIQEGGHVAPSPVRQLSHNEHLWQCMLCYQKDSVWSSMISGVALCSHLILFDWEKNDNYHRMWVAKFKESWEFPERFFVGLYGDSARRITGMKVKILYEKHRELVAAVVKYAWLCWDKIVVLGTHGIGPRGDGDDGDDDDDKGEGLPSSSSESWVDQMILAFFPWIRADHLGLEENMKMWDALQRDLSLFAEVCHEYHKQKPMMVSEGKAVPVPDALCTWSYMSEQLSWCKTQKEVQDHLQVQKEMHAMWLKHVAVGALVPLVKTSPRKAAAKCKAMEVVKTSPRKAAAKCKATEVEVAKTSPRKAVAKRKAMEAEAAAPCPSKLGCHCHVAFGACATELELVPIADGSLEEEEEVLADEVADQLCVVPRVPFDEAMAISAVFPKGDERFTNLEVISSLSVLLNMEKNCDKVELVASLRKDQSGLIYSFSQLTMVPHEMHSASAAADVQTAATVAGLSAVSMNGDVSFLHKDVTYLPPGSDEYKDLGLDESIQAAVTPEVLAAALEGFRKYGLEVPMNQQKALEHLGGSQMVFNLGIGWCTHGWKPGVEAPVGEFAKLSEMNMEAVCYHFPDGGKCLGVIFKVLGEAREAIEVVQGLEPQADEECNEKYARILGSKLQQLGCKAGECLFFVLECSRSKKMSALMECLRAKVKKKAKVDHAHVHVDMQNPRKGMPYAWVVLGTWILFYESEGKACAMQFTTILCNCASICDHKNNNECANLMHQTYLLGVTKFKVMYGDLGYESNGLGLITVAKPLVVTYLENEPRDMGEGISCWVVFEGNSQGPAVPAEHFMLTQAEKRKVKHILETVGDQKIGSK